MNPLHAASYADNAQYVTAPIEVNEPVAKNTYRLRFAAPEIAAAIVPGQFVMLRIAGCDDPLIGRAFAMYDVIAGSEGPRGVEVVYAVKGKLTTRMAKLLPGQSVQVWGPLGNGFSTQPCESLVIAAGGIGMTPFLALAREALGRAAYGNGQRASGYARRVHMIYGVRSAEYVACEAELLEAGIALQVCTDDGSRLPRVLVPHQLDADLTAGAYAAPCRIVTCGPEIMMQRVAEVAAQHTVACEASLETPMACGIGICFSCVAKVKQDDGTWDYKRTCVEGPIFAADKLVWDS